MVRPSVGAVPPRPSDAPDGGRERVLAGAARTAVPRREAGGHPLRLAALAAVVLLVLGVVPVYLGVRALLRDPVFDSLDALDVPAWAAVRTEDRVSGNRWCVIDCRFRERTAESERGWEETAQAYEQALSAAGWRPWQVELCPGQPVEGHYSCWRRDELTLDLWVRDRPCPTDPKADGTAPDQPAESQAPDVESSGPGTGEEAGSAECSGSLVTLKVRNAIDDDRNRPEPSIDPSLVGETPDPVLTDDPLSPSPS